MAVELILIHRKVDEIKREKLWINGLRKVAELTIHTTSVDHYSSSKEGAYSAEMKKRAQEQILPSIFDVAQSYEDHVMQYSLFEGSGYVHAGRGKRHTWKPIPRPARQTTRSKRTHRTITRRADHAQEAMYEASDEETEPDDTTINVAEFSLPASLPRPTTAISQNIVQTPGSDANLSKICKFDEPVLSSDPCTPAQTQGDCWSYRIASTPKSSFHKSNGLHSESGLDVKPLSRAPTVYGDNNHAMYTTPAKGNVQSSHDGGLYNPFVPYPPSMTGFSALYQPQEADTTLTPSTYVQAIPSIVNPSSMYSAQSPPMGYGCYPYASLYNSTPVSSTKMQVSTPLAPATPFAYGIYKQKLF